MTKPASEQGIRVIKILYIITLADFGGAQTHLKHLVSQLDGDTYELTVACPPSGVLVDYLKKQGIRHIPLPFLRREISLINDLRSLYQLYKVCKKEKPDIVHAHSSKAGFLGRLGAYFAGVPFIIFTVHGFSFTPTERRLQRWLFKTIEFVAGIFSRKVICVSAKDMEQALAEGIISAKRLAQIANGVAIEEFSEEKRATTRESLGFSEDHIVLGMVSRMIDEKGIPYLLSAVEVLIKRNDKLRLLLIGGGEMMERYKKWTKQKSLQDRIIFTGFREDIPQLLAAIDIFIHPSLYEAMPYAVLEAMAAGKAIIATRVGDIPELITNGLDGLLVEPGSVGELIQAIEKLVAEPMNRKIMGENAKKTIKERFTLKQTVQRTEKVYRDGLHSVRKRLRKRIPALLAAGDAILINLAFVCAFLVRFGGRIPKVNFMEYYDYLYIITTLQLIIFYFSGRYDDPEEHGYESIVFPKILQSVSIVFLAYLSYRFFIVAPFNFPRLVVIIAWALSILFITGWHTFIGRTFYLPKVYRRVALVGEDQDINTVYQTIKDKPYLGMQVVGQIADDKEAVIPGITHLGTRDELYDIVRNYSIDQVIISPPDSFQEKTLRELFNLEDVDVELNFVPHLYEMLVGRIKLRLVGDLPLISLQSRYQTASPRLWKRAFDIIASAIFIILSSPLMAAACVLILLHDKSGVLCRYPRLGLDEEPFNLLRFRVMPGQDSVPELPDMTSQEMPSWGRLLRRLHIDGLPQLFNVLKGDMSMVGPQPERIVAVQAFKQQIPAYSLRFKIKPGITGLAQVNRSYNTQEQITLKYDLIYMLNMSPWIDLIILKDYIKRILSS